MGPVEREGPRWQAHSGVATSCDKHATDPKVGSEMTRPCRSSTGIDVSRAPLLYFCERSSSKTWDHQRQRRRGGSYGDTNRRVLQRKAQHPVPTQRPLPTTPTTPPPPHPPTPPKNIQSED